MKQYLINSVKIIFILNIGVQLTSEMSITLNMPQAKSFLPVNLVKYNLLGQTQVNGKTIVRIRTGYVRLHIAVLGDSPHETRKYDLVTRNGSQPEIHWDTKYATNGTALLSPIEGKTRERKRIFHFCLMTVQFYLAVQWDR